MIFFQKGGEKQMSTINERFKMLRKDYLKISQEAFGNRAKITKASVSRIEAGINNPSDQTIALICNEFGIREEWLRDGIGPMEKRDPDDPLDQLRVKYNLSEFEMKIMRNYLALSDETRKKFENFIQKLLKEENSENYDQQNYFSESEEADEEVRYEDYIKNILNSAESTDSSASNGSEDIGEDKIS